MAGKSYIRNGKLIGKDGTNYDVGSRIEHKQFGSGKIIKIDNNDNIFIKFDNQKRDINIPVHDFDKNIINDSQGKFKKDDLKVGQTIIYGGQDFEILDLEWDEKFGYDILIEKSGRKQWIGNKVQTTDSDDKVIEKYNFEGEKIQIIKASNGKYFNEYNKGTSPVNAGPFSSLEEAKKALKKHRPSLKVDSLKTYKIKNHDTGKTYKVKGATYKDAVNTYNEFIKDSFVEDVSTNEVLKYLDEYEMKHFEKNSRRLSAEEIMKAVKKRFPNITRKEMDYSISYAHQEMRQSTIDNALNKIFKDSLTNDADLAQLQIKENFLNEEANADNIQYLGFNERRKISFYQYGDEYYAHHDLDNRTEKIDKNLVQGILKKNLLSEKDEDDVFTKDSFKGDVLGDITLQEFNPTRLVSAVKSRRQALHNNILMKDGTYYYVTVSARGYVDNPEHIWVDIIKEEPDGKQKRIEMKKFKTYEQTIEFLNKWKGSVK